MLKHLLQKKSNKQMVEKLKPKLRQEGYQASALLPKGWMARQRPNSNQLDVEFLTAKLQTLKGLERALEWLKTSNDEKKHKFEPTIVQNCGHQMQFDNPEDLVKHIMLDYYEFEDINVNQSNYLSQATWFNQILG